SADPGLPAQPEPGSQWAQDRSEPFGSFSGPSFGSSAGSPAGPVPSAQAPRRKQRGLLPLIIGIVLLVVVAPVAFIGGVLRSISSVVEDAVAGPTVLEGGRREGEVAANELRLLCGPAADAEAGERSAGAVGG